MRIFPIENEKTRFRVESTSLECLSCSKLFPRLQPKNRDLRVGDPCPACGDGKLDTRWHLTDIAVCYPIGRCECESWKYNLLKKIKLVPADKLGSLTHTQIHGLRCSHLETAWTEYALRACAEHEAGRLTLANGRTEENQP